MKQALAILNAIGARYLQINKCDEGKEKLNDTLSLMKVDLAIEVILREFERIIKPTTMTTSFLKATILEK